MALRVSSSVKVASKAARGPTAVPRPTGLPPRPVLVRFRDGGDDRAVMRDKPGAQHAPWRTYKSKYSDDQLTHTVAGQYEWQMFYMFFIAAAIFCPFIPGVTTLATAIYEGVGGKLM